MISAVGATAALGLLLSGCSSSASAPTPEVGTMEKTELHFSLDKCQQLSDVNLYKCPAVDKRFATLITMANSTVSELAATAVSTSRRRWTDPRG